MSTQKAKIALGVVALLCAIKWWFGGPSEAQLKARFVEHRAQFDELSQMFQQDAPRDRSTMYISRRSSDSALSPARIRQYQLLLKKIGADAVNGKRDRFRIIVLHGGFTDTSWSIGYAYSSQRPDFVVPSVYSWHGRQDKTAYAPLAGNWYLYNSR